MWPKWAPNGNMGPKILNKYNLWLLLVQFEWGPKAGVNQAFKQVAHPLVSFLCNQVNIFGAIWQP